MKSKLINGRALASEIPGQMSLGVAEIIKAGWSPKLGSIKVGNNPAVDPGVKGMIIQHPIPEYVSIKLLQETIHYKHSE